MFTDSFLCTTALVGVGGRGEQGYSPGQPTNKQSNYGSPCDVVELVVVVGGMEHRAFRVDNRWERGDLSPSSTHSEGPIHVSNTEGHASRRLEAINRALSGSVPPSLTPKQGYFLHPERLACESWTGHTLPSMLSSEPLATTTLSLYRASAPMQQRSSALFRISQHW